MKSTHDFSLKCFQEGGAFCNVCVCSVSSKRQRLTCTCARSLSVNLGWDLCAVAATQSGLSSDAFTLPGELFVW